MDIIFSGGSHYGVSAYMSLLPYFHKIFLLKNNPTEILALKRSTDVLIENFDESDCHFVFLGGHSSFISKEQLSRKTYINVHGSLLPKYRGMHPTFWAIMNEEEELGVTFHLVDEFMDSGDIVTQYSFPYTEQSVGEINNEISTLVYTHAGKDISAFINGKIIPTPQDHGKALYGCKRNLDDCLIDFRWDNKTLALFFKALTVPYPLPRIVLKNKIYEVIEWELIFKPYFSAVGRVLNIDDRGIWIKTQEGFLIISKLKNVETGEKEDPRNLIKIGYRMSFPHHF